MAAALLDGLFWTFPSLDDAWLIWNFGWLLECNIQLDLGVFLQWFALEKNTEIEETLDANIPRGKAALKAAVDQYKDHISFHKK